MTGSGSIEPRMNLRHPSLPVDEEGGRKRQEGIQRRQGSRHGLFVGEPTDELIVPDVVTFAHAREHFTYIGAIRPPFILQRDYLDTPRTIGFVPGRKERRLVDTVGAPGAADGYDHHFPPEFGIVQGDILTIGAGERKIQGRVAFLEIGEFIRIGKGSPGIGRAGKNLVAANPDDLAGNSAI